LLKMCGGVVVDRQKKSQKKKGGAKDTTVQIDEKEGQVTAERWGGSRPSDRDMTANHTRRYFEEKKEAKFAGQVSM